MKRNSRLIDTPPPRPHNCHDRRERRYRHDRLASTRFFPETFPRVIPRRFLATLVFGLPVLTVAFSVLMAGVLLVEGLADPVAARALRWCAIAVLMILAMDGALLIGVLSFQAWADAETREGDGDTASSDPTTDAPKS